MLSRYQLERFENDGFLCIEDVLPAAERAPIEAEYAALVARVAHERGRSDAEWETFDFERRVARLIGEDPDAYEWLDITLPLRAGLRHDAGFHAGPAVFELLRHPALLGIVEAVIGPEIYSNPVQHVRIKPPESELGAAALGNSNIARTLWHQDAAVVLEEADATPMLTVWVAMSDATIERGCMRAIRGSHRWSALGPHCPGKTGLGEIFIPPSLAEAHERVPLEVRAGGVVLLHRKTWHGAGPNLSDALRWSFDLRYQPPGLPTGRDCFPGFLARSAARPEAVLGDARLWRDSWRQAREAIACGRREPRFNERWERLRDDSLCA